MARAFFASLLLLAVLFGSPVAGIVIGWMLGTHPVTYGLPGEPDTYTAISGPAAPRPAWVPILPGATIAGAFQVIEGRSDGFGLVDLVTRSPLDEIKAFYTRSLTDLGFKVRDGGIGPNLTPDAAEFLGFAGALFAERPDEGDIGYRYVMVKLSTEEGWLIPSREVSVEWRRQIPSAPSRERAEH